MPLHMFRPDPEEVTEMPCRAPVSSRPPYRRRPSGRAVAAVIGLSTVVAVASGCMSSGGAPVVAAQPEEPARLDEVTVQRFTYPTDDDGDPEQNWADLYLPAGEQRVDSIPLAVLIHGGAWKSELGADAFDPLARELASRGTAVYNIEYRHASAGGGWPTTYTDVASALDHVVEVDKRFPQITTEDEVVVGHAIGAQLAVWSGTRHMLDDDEVGANPEFRPTRVVSIAGPLDMAYAADHGDNQVETVLGGTPDQVPDRYEMVDPIRNIDPGTPVVALIGAEDETVPPETSRRYVEKVNATGGKAKLVRFERQDHTSIISGESHTYPRVLEIIRHVSSAELNETTGG